MKASKWVFLSLFLFVAGCQKSGVGFRLPEGNVDKGKAAFVELKCYSCHTVDGVQLPDHSVQKHKPVPIGGDVARIKTYGELVTAVIHPSHKLSVEAKKEWEVDGKLSPMPDYNSAMTVQQMTDIVTFLQSRYSQLVELYTPVF